MQYQRAEVPLRLDGLQAARTFFAACFAESDVSSGKLLVAHVDEQAQCLHVSFHQNDGSEGTLPIRSIIADAAIHQSAGIVLAHDEKSGHPRPSQKSRRAIGELAAALEALHCTLVDHLIFSGSDCTSLRRLGYL